MLSTSLKLKLDAIEKNLHICLFWKYDFFKTIIKSIFMFLQHCRSLRKIFLLMLTLNTFSVNTNVLLSTFAALKAWNIREANIQHQLFMLTLFSTFRFVPFTSKSHPLSLIFPRFTHFRFSFIANCNRCRLMLQNPFVQFTFSTRADFAKFLQESFE